MTKEIMNNVINSKELTFEEKIYALYFGFVSSWFNSVRDCMLFTYSDFAKLCKVSKRTVCRIINVEGNIDIHTLFRIVDNIAVLNMMGDETKSVLAEIRAFENQYK